MLASPSHFVTPQKRKDPLGKSPTGNSIPFSNRSVIRSFANFETSFSSQVPAVFQAEPTEGVDTFVEVAGSMGLGAYLAASSFGVEEK